MVPKNRRTCDSALTKVSKTVKNGKNKYDEVKCNLSLPVISDEMVYNNDCVLKTNLNNTTVDNAPKPVVPKITIKCKPLNIEKIIDFEKNKVYVKKITTVKSTGQKKKSNSSKKLANKTKVPPSTLKNKQSNIKKNETTNSPVQLQKRIKCVQKKKMKTSIKESLPLNKKKLVIKKSKQNEETKNKEQNLEASTSQCLQNSLNCILNSDILNDKDLDDDSPLTTLKNFDLSILESPSQKISTIEYNTIIQKATDEEHHVISNSNILQKNINFRNENHLDKNNLGQISLKTAVENFLKNSQLKRLDLKKGLCISKLSNKPCSNQNCKYNHNALNLFINKLKRFPSKFIITQIVCMRNDIHFVDLVMAAFKVICERKIPVVWVTFLVFFVFYVSEPSDPRFLKFWASAARFYCELKETYSTSRGFASLLSVFSQGGTSEEWKIIEFIKFIKQPPVQVHINFSLLQPVLKMDLPCEYLMEAVRLSIATQKDILKVYSFIIPKISITKIPVHFVELLLKYCKTLEEINCKNFSDDLKKRLREKILSIKMKVNHSEFPLTAAFQDEIHTDTKEDFSVEKKIFNNGKLNQNLKAEDTENNYFQPKEDFCSLLTETMEFSPNILPNPYGQIVDVCERQLFRVKQFFRDSRFDILGKYINELNSEAVDQVAEEFVKMLFQMKISLQQVVDLVKIIVLPCKTENAAKVIASVSITLILNLVKINEWKKAYTILSLCQEKNINLVEGKVFYFNAVTQCRIALLLIEILSFQGCYTSAVNLVKEHCLFSSNNISWKLTWIEQDESIRVRILEDLLLQVISNQSTEEAYDLFQMIWKEQNQLAGAIDLKKFINEIIILLLNKENEEVINLYEQIKYDIHLQDITVRALLVFLVRQNFLSAAKFLVLSPKQCAYSVPQITYNSSVIKVSSFWLQEEIYAVFDVFFDSLIAQTPNFLNYSNNLEIHLQESTANVNLCLRPLCLGIINPSFKEASTRIQRVLEYEFNPPVKVIINPYSLLLEEDSLKLHLQKRMSLKTT